MNPKRKTTAWTVLPRRGGCAVAAGFWMFAALVWGQEEVTTPLRTYGLGPLYSAEWSGDGQWLRTDSDRGVYLWDAASGAPIRQFKTESATGTSPSVFSYDGEWIVSGSGLGDTRALLWDAATGDLVRTFEGAPSLIRCVAISRGGTRVAAASGNSVMVWDGETSALLHSLDPGGPVVSVGFSPDGTMLITMSSEAQFRLWNVETGGRFGPLLGILRGGPLYGFRPMVIRSWREDGASASGWARRKSTMWKPVRS